MKDVWPEAEGVAVGDAWAVTGALVCGAVGAAPAVPWCEAMGDGEVGVGTATVGDTAGLGAGPAVVAGSALAGMAALPHASGIASAIASRTLWAGLLRKETPGSSWQAENGTAPTIMTHGCV
ncbi:hypothetical protein OOZ51_01670 [Arthrobacter sp. MI7-26]|uniref:hypothetical protein n=1 Tax=Arthrobacter sp. MI7-26 TaxID=2993653 RepID=UPI002248A25E|nr:hypothetical protein [Arthrobacter sp. MI7-26]MCX2746522.1 hypothetical protein [Arthrobacter sp. MI7-26]